MKTLSEERIKKLERRGIHYVQPEVKIYDAAGNPTETHFLNDEKNKDELDVHLERLLTIAPSDYKHGAPSDWTVSDNGDLINTRYGYEISAEDLIERDDWILHMMEKSWMNYNSFIPAYFKALEKLGKKEVTIKIAY